MKKIVSLITVLACVITAFAIPVNAVSIPKLSGYAYFAPNTLKSAVENDNVSIESDNDRDCLSTRDAVYVDEVPYHAIVLGDVNGDGQVNSTDFINIRSYFLDINNPASTTYMAADINRDGIINSTDFMLVRRHFLEIYEITLEDTMVLEENPKQVYYDFKAEHDNRDVIFGEYSTTARWYRNERYKQYKKKVNEEYTDISYLYSEINSLDIEKYQQLDISYQDCDVLYDMATTQNEYMQSYIDLLQKLEFREMTRIENQVILNKYNPYGWPSMHDVGAFFYGNGEIHFCFSITIWGVKEDPFDREITCNFAGRDFAITNLDEVKYDIYEVLASIIDH